MVNSGIAYFGAIIFHLANSQLAVLHNNAVDFKDIKIASGSKAD